MNDKALLNEFENTLVATIYGNRVELDCTIDDRLQGSGFYPNVINGEYYMRDIYDDDEPTYLGNDLVEALKNLNTYSDYFNNYPQGNYIEWDDDRDEFWFTDFEYSIRSADEFQDVVNDMQNELKGEY